MKILQLNIWAGRLSRQIVELVQKEKPDAVCFQEVIRLPGKESVFISTLDELQDELQFPNVFFAPLFSFGYMNRKAELGNCIMSHQSFESEYVEFTNLEYTEDLDFTEIEDYNIRNFQHAVINGVHLVNHHGHHLREHKKGDKQTMRQCGRIAEYLSNQEGKSILCGDFNLEPTCESIEQINKALVNQVKERQIKSTRTALTHKAGVCDYIFTSQNIEVKDFRVLDDVASDHKALVLEF